MNTSQHSLWIVLFLATAWMSDRPAHTKQDNGSILPVVSVPSCCILMSNQDSEAALDEESEVEILCKSIDRSRKRLLSGDLLRGDQVADRLLVQEASASPLLKKHRPSMALTLADFNNILDSKIIKRLDTLDSGQHVLRADISRVNENVKTNTEKLEKHEANIRANQANIGEIRQEIKSLRQERTAFPPIDASSAPFLRSRPRQDDNAYHIARRSLRLWPIPGVTREQLWKGAGEFMSVNLGLGLRIGEEMIESIQRPEVPSGPATKDEVIVLFKNMSVRDSVMGASAKLAAFIDDTGRPTAGIRLEVPPSLRAEFGTLFKFGRIMRARHGNGTRRHVKFDDSEQTLFLNLKLPGDDVWSKVSVDVARRGLRARESITDGALERRLDPTGPLEPPRQRPASVSSFGPPSTASTSRTGPMWTGRRSESMSTD